MIWLRSPSSGHFRSLSSRITLWYAVVIAVTFGAFILVASGGVERYAKGVATSEMTTNAATFDKILELEAQQMRGSAEVLAADFGFREAFAIGDQPTIASALDSLRQRASAPLAIMIPLQGDIISTGTSLLEALEAQGLNPRSGCRMGICHTCVCTRHSGSTQDTLRGDISSESDMAVRLCVSRATSDLSLDL